MAKLSCVGYLRLREPAEAQIKHRVGRIQNSKCVTAHSSVTLQYTLQHAYGDAVFSLALFMAGFLCPGFPCGWIG